VFAYSGLQNVFYLSALGDIVNYSQKYIDKYMFYGYNDYMKIRICLLFTFFIIGSIIYATPQTYDAILYNGKRHWLLNYPLERYFFKYPDKRPKGGVSSMQWRGYNALFGISQNKLFAISINVGGKNVIEECLDELPDVFLNWWDGMLILIDGKILDHDYLGLEIYEYYKLIEIEKGNITREYRLDNEQYKKYDDITYELYKKTDEYKENLELYGITTKEYDEIFLQLNEGSLPNELVEYIINRYDLNSKLNIDLEKINQNEIENNYNIKINTNPYNIIIGLFVSVFGIGIVLLIKRYLKKHNVA
jgi:hypothetical protein